MLIVNSAVSCNDQVDRATRPPQVGVSLTHDIYNLAEVVMQTRAIRAFELAAETYPIHRLIRCAARRPLEDVFDELALNFGMTAQRLNTGSLLLDGQGAFVQAEGQRKPGYCSCQFNVWAESRERVEEIRTTIFKLLGEQRIREQMFVIDWRFSSRHDGNASCTFEELADEALLDEAYPTLGGSVASFIQQFLEAQETVLILWGPPGTGKTRLVRSILAALSRRKGDSAEVLYTADRAVLSGDEIFLNFITGSHDAFVVEDADHLLQSRSDGNRELHRFLMVADGVVRAQGRKIIFTTNLPNVGSIDEALLRPGRCFAHVLIRPLEVNEARRLTHKLCGGDLNLERRVLERCLAGGARNVTLAVLHRAVAQESAAAREKDAA